MTSRIVKLAVPAVAAALLLGACTSASPSPTATTTPARTSTTTSATPTTSATTAATVPVPAAAKQRTEAGAVAFARHYLETYNQVAISPNPGQITALSRPECQTCAAHEELPAYLKKYGQHYTSAPIRVDKVTASPEADPRVSPFRVVADVTMLGASIVDAQGKVLRSDRKLSGTYSFFLVWGETSWKVSKLKKVA